MKKEIEKLIETYTPGKIEEEKITVLDGFAGTFEKYERWLQSEKDISDIFPKIKEEITETLAPQEINAFLQQSFRYKEHQQYGSLTGMVVSQLIHNSYQQENNQFHLNLFEFPPLHYLGYNLKNSQRQRLNIVIEGNVGNCCGMYSQNIFVTVKGNAGSSCGRNSHGSSFTVQGNAGVHCGAGSCGSVFNIQGNAGSWLGDDSMFSTFYITGSVDDFFKIGERSRHSKFKTSNFRTLNTFKRQVPKENDIIYIMEGIEILERQDHDY